MPPITILIIASIVILLFIMMTFHEKGKKALSIFPSIHTVHVVYRDKSASGHSTQTWQTQMGGAKNILDIIVTDEELWLKSMPLFAGIARQHDMLHKISLDNITGVKQEGRKITLSFKSENQENKRVMITTKKPKDFIKAING